MKILRKNDEFKKMPDNSIDDVVAIKALIDYGWKFCSRREYKDFFKTSKENQNTEYTIENGTNTSKKVLKKDRKKK